MASTCCFMELHRLRNTLIRLYCRIVRTGRRLIWHFLSWNQSSNVCHPAFAAIGHPTRQWPSAPLIPRYGRPISHGPGAERRQNTEQAKRGTNTRLVQPRTTKGKVCEGQREFRYSPANTGVAEKSDPTLSLRQLPTHDQSGLNLYSRLDLRHGHPHNRAIIVKFVRSAG